MDKMGLLR